MKNELYQVSVAFRGGYRELSELKPNTSAKIQVKCPSCSKTFQKYVRLLFKTGSFECQSCYFKNHRVKHLEVGTKNNKLTVVGKSERAGYSLFLCECGKKKEILNRLFESGNTKSCGCSKVENMRRVKSKQDHRKEKHPNWQGGISSENLLLRTSKQYKQWRTEVFKGDGYNCQKCGTHGGELNAHHIKEFSAHKKEIYDVENGITFCGKCHRSFHAIHGRKNLSLEQVLKYKIGE